MDEGQKLAVRLVGRNGRRRFDQGSRDRLVAACLKLGASVSKLAREHGVNANLVWKWIRKHTQAHPLSPFSISAFIPVQVAAPSGEFDIQMPAADREERLPRTDRNGPLFSSAKVNASLPNGVRLTLECNELSGLTAISERWVMFRLGADLKVYLHREPIDFRAGINSLAVMVQETMALDPFALRYLPSAIAGATGRSCCSSIGRALC